MYIGMARRVVRSSRLRGRSKLNSNLPGETPEERIDDHQSVASLNPCFVNKYVDSWDDNGSLHGVC